MQAGISTKEWRWTRRLRLSDLLFWLPTWPVLILSGSAKDGLMPKVTKSRDGELLLTLQVWILSVLRITTCIGLMNEHVYLSSSKDNGDWKLDALHTSETTFHTYQYYLWSSYLDSTLLTMVPDLKESALKNQHRRTNLPVFGDRNCKKWRHGSFFGGFAFWPVEGVGAWICIGVPNHSPPARVNPARSLTCMEDYRDSVSWFAPFDTRELRDFTRLVPSTNQRGIQFYLSAWYLLYSTLLYMLAGEQRQHEIE